MTSKKYFFAIILLFTGTFSTIVFAQDGYTGSANTSTYDGGGEDENIYLKRNDAPNKPEKIFSKAETFNGSRAGVYEGQTLACPYAFERDLYVGSRGEDVRLLQQLLNSDRRTMIAVSGPGSLGQESILFGDATKVAVKKFQALYIEYIGIANGRFGPRTRVAMNAICNGETRPSIGRETRVLDNLISVQKDASPSGTIVTTTNTSPKDTTPPRVSLSSNGNAVKSGETFKVIVNATQEIEAITPDSLIVDGGSVKEIRKLSKTSYTAIITPNEDTKQVAVQVESGKVTNLAGISNDNASNEVTVKVLLAAGGTSTGDTGALADINSLLDKIVSSAPQCTYNQNGLLIRTDSSGKTLNTAGCSEQQTPQTKTCPNGQQVPASQQCPEQVVCNTSYNPGSYYQGFYGGGMVGGGYQQTCQTASQAQQQQQAQQMNQLGQLLGNLLGKGMGGQGQGGKDGNAFNNAGTGSPMGSNGPSSQIQSTPAQAAAALKSAQDYKDEAKKAYDECVAKGGNCSAEKKLLESAEKRLEAAQEKQAEIISGNSDNKLASLYAERDKCKDDKCREKMDEKIETEQGRISENFDKKIESKQEELDNTDCTKASNKIKCDRLQKEIDDLKANQNSPKDGAITKTSDDTCKYIVEIKDGKEVNSQKIENPKDILDLVDLKKTNYRLYYPKSLRGDKDPKLLSCSITQGYISLKYQANKWGCCEKMKDKKCENIKTQTKPLYQATKKMIFSGKDNGEDPNSRGCSYAGVSDSDAENLFREFGSDKEVNRWSNDPRNTLDYLQGKPKK